MIAAFLLGLTGSLGHCVGMCSGIILLLSRRGATKGWRLLVLHMGRITTYSLLGAGAGAAGFAIITALSYCAAPLHDTFGIGSSSGIGSPSSEVAILAGLQGGFALFAAAISIYMAFSIIGRLPSPDLLFAKMTRRWGNKMRQLSTPSEQPQQPNFFSVFTTGMLWGLLPCGLVMAGLLVAATTGSVLIGGATMLAFGVGTWPIPMGMTLLARWKQGDARRYVQPQLRYVAALVVLIFGTQMALRGFAAWGWVNHFHAGELMLW